jgi:hypothetical protein
VKGTKLAGDMKIVHITAARSRGYAEPLQQADEANETLTGCEAEKDCERVVRVTGCHQ